MRRKMKQLMGILLSLALILGLMPGMSLTAYADDPYASIKNTITVITFDSKSWYLIDYDAGTVTLLAKNCVGRSRYNESGIFVEYNNSPTVKTAVDKWYDDNITADAQTAVSGDRMFLLTKYQANAITNAEVRKDATAAAGGWWLCSQGNARFNAAFVDGGSGDVDVDGYFVRGTLGVRPALKLNLSSVIFSSESNTFSLKSSHTHSFTYAADGATITATCTADGCTLPESSAGAGDHVATLTISANGGTYDGTTAYGATITDANSIQGDAKVQYQKKSGGSYGTVTTTAPTDAGDYKASITVGGATASVEYTIAQADPTANAPTGLTATYGQTLANVSLEGKNPQGNTPGTWAWADSTKSVGNVVDPAATFKATFTPDSSNYKTVENVEVTVTVSKAAPTVTAPTAKMLTYTDTAQELVNAGSATGGTMYYAVTTENTAPTDDNLYTTSIPSKTDAGTYYVWYKVAGDGNHYDSDPACVTAEIKKAEAAVTAKEQTIKEGTGIGTGTDKAELSGQVSGHSLSAVTLSAEDGKIVPSGAVIRDAGNKDVTENYNISYQPGALTVIPRISYLVTFKVANGAWDDGEGDAATADRYVTLEGHEGDKLKLEKIQIPSAGSRPKDVTFMAGIWDVEPDEKTEIKQDTVYSYNYVKKKAAAVTKAPSANNLTYNEQAQDLVTAGEATGGQLRYAPGKDLNTPPSADKYSAEIPVGTNAGTYYVWYKVFADDTHLDSPEACFAVTIGPGNSSGSPTGHEDGLTYTGEAQELVLAGTVQGGTMLYALGEDASTPPEDSLFTREIPKGTDAGDYHVWYRVEGDANHNDVPPACLTVTINKAAIAPEVSITGWNYGESANAPELNEEGNPGNGDVIYVYSEDADGEYTQTVPTEAGSYFVFAYVAETKNYKEGRTRPIGFAISRASIAITADDKSGSYGQNVKKLTYTVYGGYVDGDDLGVSVTSNVKKGSDVGDYPITVSWTENKNYYARLYDGTYTVREARMPVSASGYRGIYDGKAHGVTVDAPGDAKIYYAATELTADNYADAGSTSAITRTGIGTATVYYYVVKKNYEPVAGKGTITIARAPIDIASAGSGGQPAAKTGTYNGKSQKLLSAPGKLPDGCAKIQYRMSGKTSWSDSIPSAAKAGNYTVEYRYVGNKNHKNSAAFRIKATIARARITITAQDKTSPRETSIKKLTWKVTGAYVSGDNLGIKASTAAKKTSKPGKYGISLSWNKNPNYTATLKKGVYTITDRITGTESARTKISMNAGFRVWWDGEDLKVSWGKAQGAERYNILAAYCGKEEPKLVRTVSGNSPAVIKITMLDGKKADHTRNIKVKVIAYRKVNGQYTKMGWSIVAHVTGSRGRTSSYTNARRVTVQKDSFVLSTGKTAVVRAETVPEIQGKKLLGEDHTPGYRYASDNKKVATVDEKGKITAVGTGTCHIYIYAQNGTSKKVSVTVK